MDYLTCYIISIVMYVQSQIERTTIGIIILKIIKCLFHCLLFIFPPLDKLICSKNNSGIYGTAGFANIFEKCTILNPLNKEGLTLDKTRFRIAPKVCQQHLMLCSPTGQGKTSCFLYPTLLNPSKNSSYVITDVSGECFQDCSGFLAKKGFKILRLNLIDHKLSHQFNPVTECKTISDYDRLAHLLVSSTFQNNGSKGSENNFWNNSAKMILATLLKVLKNHPDNHFHNLHNLRYLVNQLSIDTANLNELISKYATKEIFNDYMGFISQEPKLLNDVLSTAKVSLKAFADPMLCEVTTGSQIDFKQLRKQPTVLFISYRVEDASYLQFFLSIFWSQVLSSFTKVDLKDNSLLNIYCLLDEFQNLSRIPNFENSIAILRKYKVSLFLMLQGLDGLNTYGDTAKIITGNCKTKLFTGSLQHSDNELISKMCGDSTVLYKSPYSEKFTEDEKIRDIKEIQRPLMTAEEIRRIQNDRCLMFHGNNRPLLLDLKPFYKDKKLLRRTKLSPVNLEYSTQRTPLKYLNLKKIS